VAARECSSASTCAEGTSITVENLGLAFMEFKFVPDRTDVGNHEKETEGKKIRR
jgi:hypothetical protein